MTAPLDTRKEPPPRFGLAELLLGRDDTFGRYPVVANSPRFRLAHGLAEFWIDHWPARGGAFLAKRLARALLPPLGNYVVCRTRMGFDLVVCGSDGGNYYLLGAYERGTLHVMKHCLGEGDVFVDVGASVGQMALYASQLVGDGGKVVAIEPHPERYTSLVDAIVLNQRNNVVAHRLALDAVASRDRPLYCDRVSPSMVAIEGAAPAGQKVDTQRLEDILEREGVAAPRMVKIDVEGFEPNVIRGGERVFQGAGAPIVCIEHGMFGADPFAALRLLASLNQYAFFNLTASKDRPSRLRKVDELERLRKGDNVFCFLPSHLDDLRHTGLFE